MSVPVTGLGSWKTPLILRGKNFKCPLCDGTDQLYRNETVLRSVGVKPVEGGGYDWDTETRDEVAWDTSDHSPGEPEFFCRGCDRYFEAPEVSNA